MYFVIIFNIFVQTGPNLHQIYILAVSSIIACATLHSTTRAITWKRDFKKNIQRGSKCFTEGNTYSFSHHKNTIGDGGSTAL